MILGFDPIAGPDREAPPARDLRRFERPPKITLSITETCPLNCLHCYGDCGRGSRAELTTAEWLAIIDRLIEDGVIQLYIEGGEPFHRPDFFSLLERCCPQAMTLVRSHGTMIDAEMARRIHRVGVGRVFIDLMGATAQTHEFFTGVTGSFVQSCRAVSALREAGVAVDVLVILTRQTAPELTLLAKLAHRLGAERIGILRLYPLGRAKRRWAELALSLDEQMAALGALTPPEGLRVMQSWHPHDRNCCWQAAAINAYGDSIGCMYLREYVNFGNVREIPFLASWNEDPLYRTLRAGQVERGCAGCSADSKSDGGCRSAAYAFHGRWTAPDPFCTTLNAGVDLCALPAHILWPACRHQIATGPRDGPVLRLRSCGPAPLHSQHDCLAGADAVCRCLAGCDRRRISPRDRATFDHGRGGGAGGRGARRSARKEAH